MNELQVFTNTSFGNIRTIKENEKILFCGFDVAKMLKYSNPRDALDRHCQCVVKRDVPHPQSKNKNIEMSFIPEGDVWRLISHSKMPQAQQIERWIFDEVLPTIRKTGKYEVKQAPEQTQLPSLKYRYEPKTYHGQVVCTVRDIEHFTGIETHKISSKIHNNKSLVHGTDYWMLEGNDLAYFKSKYPTIVTSVRHLFILTKSGFSKLFGTAPEYAKALPCYNIVQAKSERTVELPVKTINWAKGMCTDVPENPEAQQLITHIRKVLISIDMMLDECNMYHRKEEDYKRCAYAAYQLSNRASRLALDLYTFKPKMVEKYL